MGVMPPVPWWVHVPPCVPLQSAHPTTLMGCCSHCWLFVVFFPALRTTNEHLLRLWSGDVLPEGRRLNSPVWISFLLLSDSCISGRGLSEFCSSPLERCSRPSGLGPTMHFTSTFLTLHQRYESRCWPDLDLRQASGGLGVSHR